MFHLWGTFYFYKANNNTFEIGGGQKIKSKNNNFGGQRVTDGRTHNLALYIRIMGYMGLASISMLRMKQESQSFCVNFLCQYRWFWSLFLRGSKEVWRNGWSPFTSTHCVPQSRGQVVVESPFSVTICL